MNVSVILPSLNPDEKLLLVVEALVKRGFRRIILINDGSDEAHMAPFEKAAEYPQCVLLRHYKNLGKGRALKTGFNYFLCHQDGDIGVVTVDGDNQHHIDDIEACARKLEEHPDAMVLGCRDFSQPDVPSRSRFGNRSASFLFKAMVGLSISDTQTGLRAIPTNWLYEFVDLYGERFEYETNMLLEIKRLSIPLLEQPIRTIYLDENVGSHFRPVRDTLKICRLLFRFIAVSAASFLVDILLFWLLGMLFAPLDLARRILFATAGARVLSSVFNYLMNRKAVFGQRENVRHSLWKYYLLCVVQAAVSYGGVYLLTSLTADSYSTAWKVLVDLLLFLLSFQIQREWVFRKNDRKGLT